MYNKVFSQFTCKYMFKYIYDTSTSKDLLRYRSALRKTLINNNGLRGFVENHHIIPKQWRNHSALKRIDFDVNSSYNILIMPNNKYKYKYKSYPGLLVHANGHKKYNEYVKLELDELDRIYVCDGDDDGNDDEFKYNFWLFYIYLKGSLNNNSVDIPWN